MSESRQETRYLIARNMRIRGFQVEVQHEDCIKALGFAGEFELTIMPGNRRVLISQHAMIYPEFRGKGHGQTYLRLREEIAQAAGCNLLLATVREDNLVQVHILEKAGWRRYNQRSTGVSLWGKEL
jgi:RimJ/RimL family protein N-acetyltransferase